MSARSAQEFHSILWPCHAATDTMDTTADTLRDLALDQVLARLPEDSRSARAAWIRPLSSLSDIAYRQQVFSGLEDRSLRDGVRSFLRSMASCTRIEREAATSGSALLANLRHVDAVRVYADAVLALEATLDVDPDGDGDPSSGSGRAPEHVGEGWRLLAAHVRSVCGSPAFAALRDGVAGIQRDLAAFRYDALIREGKVIVAPHRDTESLLDRATTVFTRFEEPALPRSGVEDSSTADEGGESTPAHGRTVDFLDHVQVWMLEHAAAIAPDVFTGIRAFAAETAQFRDPLLDRFCDEVRFYLEYLDLLIEAIEAAGYTAGRDDVAIALDPAANGFFLGDGTYRVNGLELGRTQLVDYYRDLLDTYPIRSLEDGFAEDDHEGWKALAEAVSDRVQLVGDDLYVTDPVRIRDGAEHGLSNAVLIKPNQIGTVSRTLEAITTARDLGLACMVSHRSGETADTFIADLVVGTGVGQIKSGAPARGERVAKYNRLTEISLDHPEIPYGLV